MRSDFAAVVVSAVFVSLVVLLHLSHELVSPLYVQAPPGFEAQSFSLWDHLELTSHGCRPEAVRRCSLLSLVCSHVRVPCLLVLF